MGLNIKNEAVHALAKEAAQKTGRTQTSVIELALQELLSRLSTNHGAEAERRYRETMELAEYCASRMSSADHLVTTDELYDENGLPA